MRDLTARPSRREEWLAGTLARKRVPLGFVFAAFVIWLARPTFKSLAIGGAMAIAGEAFRIWAAGHLEKGLEVTRSGPYRISRHPLYIGSAIIGVGVAVAARRQSVTALIAVYLIPTLLSAIRTEEAGMRASFGDQYDAYVQSRSHPVKRPFSFARAMRNKEYRTIAGVGAMAAVFAIKALFGSQ